MAQTWIAGYEIAITIDSKTTIGLSANTADVAYSAGSAQKQVLGSPAAFAIATQATGTFSASGHGTVENIPDLAALRDPTAMPVDVEVTYGDGGSDAFSAVFDSVSISPTADGELDWSISAMIDGLVTYTPPVPPE